MKGISITLLTVRIAIVGSIFIGSSALAPLPLYYELIYGLDVTTEETGSISMRCRSISTAELLLVDEVLFFLNRSSAADPSIREREDITVVVDGCCGVRFNLTRRLEGSYTCGERVDATNVRESAPKILICKWVLN
jgi:hypothetical protein